MIHRYKCECEYLFVSIVYISVTSHSCYHTSIDFSPGEDRPPLMMSAANVHSLRHLGLSWDSPSS